MFMLLFPPLHRDASLFQPAQIIAFGKILPVHGQIGVVVGVVQDVRLAVHLVQALLLGGNTATLWKGRVTQFGPTPQVYRQPVDATTARVFSDPPMNFLPFQVAGGRASVAGMPALPDGRYLAGFRPNHLHLSRHAPDAVQFDATLVVTELTGSETFVHLDHHGQRWVGLIHGVHELPLGQVLPVWLDPRHVYVFAEDGRMVTPAAYASAA